MEYLIFKSLAIAVTASIIIWYNMKRRNKSLKENKANPQELEDGKYAVQKPEDKYMAGVEYDEVIIDPKLKENAELEKPPTPKGDPTIRP